MQPARDTLVVVAEPLHQQLLEVTARLGDDGTLKRMPVFLLVVRLHHPQLGLARAAEDLYKHLVVRADLTLARRIQLSGLHGCSDFVGRRLLAWTVEKP